MSIAAEELRERRSFFDDMVQRASRRGFKPGFASAKYKEMYGDWPPKSWSKRVQEIFLLDDAWQAKLAHRMIEAAHYEEWERDVKPIAEARKAEWMAKHAGPERVVQGDRGSIAQCYQSEKRARPIHGLVLGDVVTLCGKLVERWLTNRKVFSNTTEYGCKKCKAIFAKRNQLPLGGVR